MGDGKEVVSEGGWIGEENAFRTGERNEQVEERSW